MKISSRLEAIARLIENGSRVADIGTDHGFLPIFLLEKDIIDFAVCSDIKKGPLSSAEKNIKRFGFSNKTRLCLADGLKGIEPNEVDTVVIAGMGGEMIAHILEECLPEGAEKFILQPMRNVPVLRKKLHQLGLTIIDEMLVREKDKFYIIISSKVGKEPSWSKEQYIVSDFIKKDPLWNDYAAKERKKIVAALSKLVESDKEDKKEEFQELLEIYK